MPLTQPCARFDCEKTATYEKPLCYDHWLEWEAWELEECSQCHWVGGSDDSIMYDAGGYDEEFPHMCDPCLWFFMEDQGKHQPWQGRPPEQRPTVLAHAELERTGRYVYILKLADGSFYIGQTVNLPVRVTEHRDGIQSQTRGKAPRLVYFEYYEGSRDEVRERENELTLMNQTPIGRRGIRETIEHFREPLRLLDLEA